MSPEKRTIYKVYYYEDNCETRKEACKCGVEIVI